MFQLIQGLRFAFPKTMERIEADYAGLVALHDRMAAQSQYRGVSQIAPAAFR